MDVHQESKAICLPKGVRFSMGLKRSRLEMDSSDFMRHYLPGKAGVSSIRFCHNYRSHSVFPFKILTCTRCTVNFAAESTKYTGPVLAIILQLLLVHASSKVKARRYIIKTIVIKE
jgi:hypothetical protein